MENFTTTNLADFGYRELKMAYELLKAMFEDELPDEFEPKGITIMLNKYSGYVFLTNDEYQVAMLNGDKLEMFYYCPKCGNEGFAEDINWSSEYGCCGECAPEDDKEEWEDDEE